MKYQKEVYRTIIARLKPLFLSKNLPVWLLRTHAGMAARTEFYSICIPDAQSFIQGDITTICTSNYKSHCEHIEAK